MTHLANCNDVGTTDHVVRTISSGSPDGVPPASPGFPWTAQVQPLTQMLITLASAVKQFAEDCSTGVQLGVAGAACGSSLVGAQAHNAQTRRARCLGLLEGLVHTERFVWCILVRAVTWQPSRNMC